MAISGGTPIALCEATNPFGVNWEADGTILFGQREGIRRVPSNGGPAQLIVGAEVGEQMYGTIPGLDTGRCPDRVRDLYWRVLESRRRQWCGRTDR